MATKDGKTDYLKNCVYHIINKHEVREAEKIITDVIRTASVHGEEAAYRHILRELENKRNENTK